MAELTPEEASQWWGGAPPTKEEMEAEARRAQEDPLGLWWDTVTGNRNGVFGRQVSAQGGGFDPMRTPNEAAAQAEAYGVPGSVRGSAAMDARFMAGAQAASRDNPYVAAVANQVRPAQGVLYEQMRAQQAGPSLAAMQGARAQGQNLQAALAAGGGRPVMGQAGGIGAGLAGDTGSARLAEQLRGTQAIGGMASGVRAADIGVANAQSQSGLQQRGLDDAMRQFYGSQGARLYNANADLAAEREKLVRLGKIKRDARDLQTGKDFAASSASTLSAGLG